MADAQNRAIAKMRQPCFLISDTFRMPDSLIQLFPFTYRIETYFALFFAFSSHTGRSIPATSEL